MEDTQIIRLYWLRDQDAIVQTDKKYGNLCRGLSYRILSNREDAEECVSDTYLAAWHQMPPQKPAYLKGFLARIVRNISISRLRERYSKKNGGGELPLVLEELEQTLASNASVEREYEQKELAAAINRFLETVSQDDRAIFLCRYWRFLSVSEIAQCRRFSESKVKTSLCRTRKKLRNFLESEGLL